MKRADVTDMTMDGIKIFNGAFEDAVVQLVKAWTRIIPDRFVYVLYIFMYLIDISSPGNPVFTTSPCEVLPRTWPLVLSSTVFN